jgi:hypothetical protein
MSATKGLGDATRAGYIAGVRGLADLLEANPTLELPDINIGYGREAKGELRWIIQSGVEQVLLIRGLMKDPVMHRESGTFPLSYSGTVAGLSAEMKVLAEIAMAKGQEIPKDFEINPLLLDEGE